VLVLLGLVAAPASADRELQVRFSKNDAGDILLAANGILSCQGDQAGCSQARDAARGAQLGNNAWAMRYIDVDSNSGTFDSSSAELALPPGASVLFAGLYWGANTVAGSRGQAAPNAAARNEVRLATPAAGGYTTVRADQLDEGTARSQRGAYQGFANVTAAVRTGGAGTYTVANVQSATGLDRYGGWSLVVVYSGPAESPRNLTVFDGFVSVNNGDAPRELSISGFRTPGFGPVRSRIGLLAYEGDLSLGGDTASLNGTTLGSGGKATNFFNSEIKRLGQNVTTRSPAYVNNLGYDSSILDATGLIPNRARSAAIRLKTTSDTYLPGMVFLATDLFAPDLQSSKSVVDLNGGLVESGDVLEYTITGTNRGQDAAASVVVSDAVPANTAFVPGSLVVGGAAQSDAIDGDTAEHAPGGGLVVFRPGAGATGTAGGRVTPGETYAVRYRVRVAAGVPDGAEIRNRARVSRIAETLGFVVDTPTNDTLLRVSAPDLTISKAFSGTVLPGEVVTYALTVSNIGRAASRGAVTVTDPMPDMISFSSVEGDGWNCAPLDPAIEVTCTRTDGLAPGAAYPPIIVTGTIIDLIPGGFINTSIVGGGGDVNQANNTSTAAPPGSPISSLALDKQVDLDTAAPGDLLTYIMRVSNRGGFGPATNVVLNDPLPAGLTLVSAEALDQGSCTGAVTCSLGTVPGGSTVRVRVRARVNDNVPSGQLGNTAVVTSSAPDHFPGDNTATASTRIRTSADLTTSKALAGQPNDGGPVRWTITASNAGPNAIPSGLFNDVVPAVVRAPAAVVPGGSCTVAGRLLSCRLPQIPVGGQATIEVSGRLPARSGGRYLFNGAQVIPHVFQPDLFPLPPRRPLAPSGGETPLTNVVLPAADLGVAKAGTPEPAARDGLIRYHVRATNHGPSRATGILVRDRLPAGARFVRDASARACRVRGRVVRCALGSLRANRSVSFDIAVRLRAGAGARTVRNRISIDGRQPDPAGANDRDRIRSRLAPRVVVTKSTGTRRASIGQAVSYVLRTRNRGPGGARNVLLCDRPGGGLRIRHAPGATRRGTAYCWRIGRLAVGRTVTRRVVATLRPGSAASRANRATVSVGSARTGSTSAVVQVRGRVQGRCPVSSGAGPQAHASC
jgi:uncharacterized repeat protein (TIGR01451 family)